MLLGGLKFTSDKALDKCKFSFVVFTLCEEFNLVLLPVFVTLFYCWLALLAKERFLKPLP